MKNISIDEIKKIVSESETISGALKKIGYARSSACYKQFKKFVTKHSIDISHFLSPEEFNKKYCTGKKFKSKLLLNEIFCVNSNVDRTTVKKRFLELNPQEKKCKFCNQDENWQGKIMHLILDHINGISNDNRLENLRILCPNCNATLDTHGGKKRRKFKTCDTCEKKFHGHGAKYCSNSCKFTAWNKSDKILNSSARQRKTVRPPYETLLNEVRELGFCAVGKKYGVTDNSIRKWIKLYEKLSR